jgi:hypothetical protein
MIRKDDAMNRSDLTVIEGHLRRTPGLDEATELVNLAASIHHGRVLLTAHFATTTRTHLRCPLDIALTPALADDLAAGLHAHAVYLDPALSGHHRWRN